VIPIAKEPGIVRLAPGGPERIFDIAVISKIQVPFAMVMFAPGILCKTSPVVCHFNARRFQVPIPTIRERTTEVRGPWPRSIRKKVRPRPAPGRTM
ncbi:MAG: hypothetical protein PHT99_11875, partial [Methanoregula sp.]|nr:hypothetical protein [Methanoregula sp.]